MRIRTSDSKENMKSALRSQGNPHYSLELIRRHLPPEMSSSAKEH